MMSKINQREIIEQFQILQVPITANIDNLRRARDLKLHQLYKKSAEMNNPTESLALDTEIATIQRAYLSIKKHFDEIKLEIDVHVLLKEQYAILDLSMTSSLEQVRHKRNEILLKLIEQDSGKYSPKIEERIKQVQAAYNIIANNYCVMKGH